MSANSPLLKRGPAWQTEQLPRPMKSARRRPGRRAAAHRGSRRRRCEARPASPARPPAPWRRRPARPRRRRRRRRRRHNGPPARGRSAPWPPPPQPNRPSRPARRWRAGWPPTASRVRRPTRTSAAAPRRAAPAYCGYRAPGPMPCGGRPGSRGWVDGNWRRTPGRRPTVAHRRTAVGRAPAPRAGPGRGCWRRPAVAAATVRGWRCAPARRR